MTEEKKIARLKDLGDINAEPPSFPSVKRGGYLEDAVDEYFAQVFDQFSKTTQYQQETYDAYLEQKQAKEAALSVKEELEARITELEERLNDQVQDDLLEAAEGSAEVDSTAVVSEEDLRAQVEEDYRQSVLEREAVFTGQIDSLNADLVQVRTELAEAQIALEEAQNAPAPEAVSDAVKATGIIASAERLAREHVDEAEHRAANIVEEAEGRIGHLLDEIRGLEVSRQAAVRTLTEFHEDQLRRLPSYSISEEVAPEVTSAPEDDTETDRED